MSDGKMRNDDLKAQADFLLKQAEIIKRQYELQLAEQRIKECEEFHKQEDDLPSFLAYCFIFGFILVFIMTELFKG